MPFERTVCDIADGVRVVPLAEVQRDNESKAFCGWICDNLQHLPYNSSWLEADDLEPCHDEVPVDRRTHHRDVLQHLSHDHAVLSTADHLRQLPSSRFQLDCNTGRSGAEPRYRIVPDNLRNVPYNGELDQCDI